MLNPRSSPRLLDHHTESPPHELAGTFLHRDGWLGIDAIQQACASRFPALAAAAPGLVAEAAPAPSSPILLYKAWRDVLGKDPAYPAQQIGDCVSFGHGHANDLLQCIEIALGEPAEFRETDTEFIYATSREVAGILGGCDGSYGAAAVKAMTTIGMVSREMLGDQGAYSGRRAKDWGRTGAPADVKSKAAPFKLGSAALVSTWDELVGGPQERLPGDHLLEPGVHAPSRPGRLLRGTGRLGALHADRRRAVRPRGRLHPAELGPRRSRRSAGPGPADVLVLGRSPVVERILAAGDSWALSKAPEFVARPLPAHWSYDQAA